MHNLMMDNSTITIFIQLTFSSCAKAKCSSYFPLWTAAYVGCGCFVLRTNFLDRMTQFKLKLRISFLASCEKTETFFLVLSAH